MSAKALPILFKTLRDEFVPLAVWLMVRLCGPEPILLRRDAHVVEYDTSRPLLLIRKEILCVY